MLLAGALDPGGVSRAAAPSLADDPTWDAAVRLRDSQRRAFTALSGLEFTESGVQVVPIRFPTPVYEQLKAWSQEQNFPMAAVVRGLVERFLDSQGMPQP